MGQRKIYIKEGEKKGALRGPKGVKEVWQKFFKKHKRGSEPKLKKAVKGDEKGDSG